MDPGFRKRGVHLADVYCDVTVMKSDVLLTFPLMFVQIFTGMLLESEALETILLATRPFQTVSPFPPGPFVPMPAL